MLDPEQTGFIYGRSDGHCGRLHGLRCPGRSWTFTASGECGLAPGPVAGVFSIDLESDEPTVHALAESLGVPARFFAAVALEAEAPRLRNPSDLVLREVGCHGVAEGAAPAAARTFDDSAVYDAAHHHLLRPRKKKRAAPSSA